MEVERAAPYTVLRKLGQGAMGVVYEAFDARRGSKVALKMLSRMSATALYRFKNEFRALVDIDHPNLVTLYELRSEEDTWFYTMELIEGIGLLEYVRPLAGLQGSARAGNPIPETGEHQTTQLDPSRATSARTKERPTVASRPGSDRLLVGSKPDSAAAPGHIAMAAGSRTSSGAAGGLSAPRSPEGPQPRRRRRARLGPLDETRARDALCQLAHGVHALHEAGRLHRDLKPSNVLVDGHGRVAICDFGLVVDLAGESQRQTLGRRSLLGTVAYMSPEQAASRELTEASDWYAVGVILYEMLTGALPFTGEMTELILAKQSQDPVPPEQFLASLDSSVPAAVPIDLADLSMELMARDAALRPRGVDILQRLGGRSRPRPRTAPLTDYVSRVHGASTGPLFIGRDDAVASLAGALDHNLAGQCVAVLISGSAGIGKSTLVHHVLAGRAAPITILSGRCYERESLPYKALDSLMDTLAGRLDQLPAEEILAISPYDLFALTRLFPVFGGVAAVTDQLIGLTGDELAQDPHELRRHGASALRHIFCHLASKGALVLFIDDLQWGDSDSAQLLARVLEPPDTPPLAFVGCYRREDRKKSPFLRTLDQTLSRWAALVRDIELEPFSPNEIAALVTNLGAGDLDHHAARHIAHESSGNPFVACELIRFLEDSEDSGAWLVPAVVQDDMAEPGTSPGSPTSASEMPDPGRPDAGAAGPILDHVLACHLARLPGQARRLFGTLAVAGRPIAQEDALRVAEVERDATAAIIALEAAHLIRSSGAQPGDDIEIFHDCFRSAMLAHMPASEVTRLHRRLAEFYEETPGDRDAEALLEHWRGAGDDKKARRYALAAAARAQQALAFDRAAELYELVLALDRGGPGGPGAPDEALTIAVERGEALANGGRNLAAAEVYQAAAGSAKSPVQAMEILRRAGMHLLIGGRIDEGIAILSDVMARLGVTVPRSRLGRLLSLVLRRITVRLRGLGFRPRRVDEIGEEELIRIDTCVSACKGLSIVDPIRAADYQTQALLLSLSAGEPVRIARLLVLEGAYLAMRGARPRRRAARVLARADQLIATLGSHELDAFILAVRGTGAYLRGDFAEGLALCEQSESIYRTRCIGIVWELDILRTFQIWSLYYLGRWAEQGRRLAMFEAEALARGAINAHTNLSLPKAYWHLARDQPDEARRALDAATANWLQHGFRVQHMLVLIGQVHVDLYLGDVVRAWQRVEETWPLLRRSLILRVQQPRVLVGHLIARVALASHACLRQAGKDSGAGPAAPAISGAPATWLRRARKQARALEREGVAWARGLAALVRAGVACQSGQRDQAVRELERAETFVRQAGLLAYAAACQYRRGQLVADGALIAQAVAWMREQGIADLARTVDVHTPGFEPAASALVALPGQGERSGSAES